MGLDAGTGKVYTSPAVVPPGKVNLKRDAVTDTYRALLVLEDSERARLGVRAVQTGVTSFDFYQGTFGLRDLGLQELIVLRRAALLLRADRIARDSGQQLPAERSGLDLDALEARIREMELAGPERFVLPKYDVPPGVWQELGRKLMAAVQNAQPPGKTTAYAPSRPVTPGLTHVTPDMLRRDR